MKFNVDSFVVEIKVRHAYEKKNNKKAAMYFINWWSLLLFDSALLKQKQYEESHTDCTKTVSDMRYDMASQLHDLLSNQGFYDDIH